MNTNKILNKENSLKFTLNASHIRPCHPYSKRISELQAKKRLLQEGEFRSFDLRNLLKEDTSKSANYETVFSGDVP